MNQLLELAAEVYGGLETFSRLVFPPLRRVVRRMSAGPALYRPTVTLLQNANVAVVPDQSSKVCRDESINASRAIFGGGGDGHSGRHTKAPSRRKLNGGLKKQYSSQSDDRLAFGVKAVGWARRLINGPITGITDEWKPCGCGMNACCGECLREERRRHLLVLWLATVLVVLAVVALSLIVGTPL